jgi:hypothetical protein
MTLAAAAHLGNGYRSARSIQGRGDGWLFGTPHSGGQGQGGGPRTANRSLRNLSDHDSIRIGVSTDYCAGLATSGAADRLNRSEFQALLDAWL